MCRSIFIWIWLESHHNASASHRIALDLNRLSRLFELWNTLAVTHCITARLNMHVYVLVWMCSFSVVWTQVVYILWHCSLFSFFSRSLSLTLPIGFVRFSYQYKRNLFQSFTYCVVNLFISYALLDHSYPHSQCGCITTYSNHLKGGENWKTLSIEPKKRRQKAKKSDQLFWFWIFSTFLRLVSVGNLEFKICADVECECEYDYRSMGLWMKAATLPVKGQFTLGIARIHLGSQLSKIVRLFVWTWTKANNFQQWIYFGSSVWQTVKSAEEKRSQLL